MTAPMKPTEMWAVVDSEGAVVRLYGVGGDATRNTPTRVVRVLVTEVPREGGQRHADPT